ncbi:type II secretion system F family protein [Actinoplanes sichuanensis]|uniref:Type II secretion system F family protein n=1 Tax=Actinoplanes sichuanensis TaxID=512349 RepID=A0ABW4ABM5_9ACTN|nr:type II secretion system F family protein [Actinoplanes sichuanensis]
MVLVFGGGAAFLAGYAAIDAVFGRTPIQRRLAVLRRFSVRTPDEGVPVTRRLMVTAGRRLEAVPMLARLAARDEAMLDRLGGGLRPAEWLAVRLAAGTLLAVAATALLPWPFALVIGMLVGYLGAGAVLRSRVQRRERQFGDDLPGALNLMTSSLRAGFTLHQSLEAAVRDDNGPVAAELRRALAETRIGGSFEDALERVGERMRSPEMVWLVMALRLQREVGGSLVDVMQTTADTMRERAYIKRHVRALSGEGRISAWVLGSMPLLTALGIQLVQPGYLRPLYTTPTGLILLAIAVLGMVVGGFWLRAVVRVEV